ncbi:MAG: DUF86 domain-containing protein [Acidobacteria bacterium]|nr:MAG: DUF86 domain-containing protein [Acidobacteriota bacterium]
MVLKPDSIVARLLKLEEVISGLEELRAEHRAGLPRNLRDLWSIERGLQLGAEILLDVGNHVLSASFGITAEDYEDILEQLARRRVIGAELYGRLKGLGGFRNVLVHMYLRIDPERVAQALDTAPELFTAFAAAVRAWLADLAKHEGC